MSGQREGFSLVEVVIASTVLVIALFGILSMAFNTYRKSDMADEAITAANLAAERLAYFRAHDIPHRAVGGTFYAAPSSRGQKDFNTPEFRAKLHLIANERPILFVREWLYAPTEKRFKTAAGVDEGRQLQDGRHTGGAAAGAALGEEVNYVRPLNVRSFACVLPNTGAAAGVPANPATFNEARNLNGTNDQTIAFTYAPRANPAIGGDLTVGNFPASLRYAREVWIQTNHPLGKPFTGDGDGMPNSLTYTLPTFYTAGAGDTIRNTISRNAGASAATGNTIRLPEWVIQVTVRVFARDPLVNHLTPSDAVPTRTKEATGYKGWGYDPRKPLATAVGYFGVRHQLGY